ncbi:alpha/beta hydrolase family protein [Ancylobacter lacus]|uniref:hypothetical protein n=1 Tax=Ancylobacter lacus TaxID=2579970 RepID=UPI001BCC886C|nr:hypothetical protein [Ancylobacter lacus]MBS7539719.1 hypothetical protein [Ancylobacter lacus]
MKRSTRACFLLMLAAAFLALVLPGTRAEAATRPAAAASGAPRVYLMRGLANIFSLGMDDLAAKLQARGIVATVHSYADWQSVAAAAEKAAKAGRRATPVVVIGHSLGADAAVNMANTLVADGVPVPLVVTFDPITPPVASAKIGKLVNYYQGTGAGKRITGGRVSNIDLTLTGVDHFSIDKVASVHDQIIAMIVAKPRPAVRQRPRPTVAPAEGAAPAPTSQAPASPAPAGAAPAPTASLPESPAASTPTASAVPAAAPAGALKTAAPM